MAESTGWGATGIPTEVSATVLFEQLLATQRYRCNLCSGLIARGTWYVKPRVVGLPDGFDLGIMPAVRQHGTGYAGCDAFEAEGVGT